MAPEGLWARLLWQIAVASRREEAVRRNHVRDANEGLERASAGLGQGGSCRAVYHCECGNPACTSVLPLTMAQYESARAYPARFVIARNHENPEDERIVSETGCYAIVETVTREPLKLALEYNPRWQRGAPW